MAYACSEWNCLKLRFLLGKLRRSSAIMTIGGFSLLLLYAYPKNATANMTTKQTAQLAKLVKEEFGNEI